MNNKDIEWRREKLKEEKIKLESGQLNAVRELLTNEVILKVCEDCHYYFRSRLLTPLVIVFHMLSSGFSREGSFRSAWQVNGQTGRSGSLAKGRKRLPLRVWEQIDAWMMGQIEEEISGKDRWHGHRMIGVDGTSISMSSEPGLAQHFGLWNSRHGKSRFPVGRLLLAFNLKTLITVKHKASSSSVGEIELFKTLLPELQAGDVLIGDRHFAGANLYAEYQALGIEFITRVHQKLRIEHLEILGVYNPKDFVVKMPVGKDYRKKSSSLPESISARLIETQVKIRGKRETFWIATSLSDAEKYPAHEIRDWYKKRWKVEGLIEELKIWVGTDVLRSKTVEGIFKELYARVIGFNLVHWLISRAAQMHRQDPERLSVSAALRLTVAQSLKMSTAPFWQLTDLFRELLDLIAHSVAPYRPDRVEPRMTKRKPKDYPTLKISRLEWRGLYATAA